LGDYGNPDGVFDLYPKIQSLTTITSTIVETFITRTEANINARIAHLYTVPVGGSPPALKDIAETAVVGRLMRRFLAAGDQELADKWLEDADKFLELIATGSATLVSSAGVVVDRSQIADEPFSSTKDYVPTFSVLDTRDAWLDPDRRDDEQRKRDIL